MHVRVLGSAAGGGLPQWNCACAGCEAARRGEIPARTQSSIAVSSDGEQWLLVNASPDVRTQLVPFGPARGRGSRVAAVVVTSADIDHASGLLVLREGWAPPIYATGEVEAALREGIGILPALSAFGRVDMRPLEPSSTVSFADRDGKALGVEAEVIDVAGKPPPYTRKRLGDAPGPGHVVALLLREAGGGREVLYAPGVSSCAPLEAALARASLVLVDGTCFTDDELAPLGGKRAREMGHVPVSGPDGSLARLVRLTKARRVYVHVNNTNPMLLPRSSERAEVEAAGVEVGVDGLAIEV